MKWVKKYIKNDNIHFFVIIVEINKIMTVMIIQNQKLTFICCMRFSTILKMM